MKNYAKRFVYMVLAIAILSFGIALLRFSSFGTDPFNCMNLGVSSHLPISYGTYQVLLNIVLFIPLVILKPAIFGPGAVVNMFCVAYFVEFFTWLIGLFGVTIDGVSDVLPARIILLILGVVFVCLGVAIYMECNMGTAAYDAIGQVVDERSKGHLKFKWVRVFTDCTCMLIGFVSGSIVGIGTVVCAFFTGPLVSYFRGKFKMQE